MIKKFLLTLASLILVTPNLLCAKSADSLYSIPMSWVDDSRQEISLNKYAGKYVVLTMAYTTCRSSCPLTFEKLKRIESVLKEQNKKVDFVVVSLDPEVDTPDTLASYRAAHKLSKDNWHLLRGDKASTRKLSHLVGISFDKDKDSGEIMHSNSIQLLAPDGQIIENLTGLGADITQLVAKVPPANG